MNFFEDIDNFFNKICVNFYFVLLDIKGLMLV